MKEDIVSMASLCTFSLLNNAQPGLFSGTKREIKVPDLLLTYQKSHHPTLTFVVKNTKDQMHVNFGMIITGTTARVGWLFICCSLCL